ncbi:MAG: alpha/beta hydrolase [Theionarchaea archaeon]|nr:alpha/beta hydrolase [Theionarchaea archaeon]
MILTGLGVIIGAILIYLVVIIFFPVLSVPSQPIHKAKPEQEQVPPKCRNDVTFTVEETTVRAWLYLPREKSTPVPCIIISQGFGGTKDMQICESYALRFVDAGMAVLAYDYRHFGASDGEPRQLFSIARQVEDLKAAINYVRNRKEINSDKIALWGTSAAGGYGLIIAAQDPHITCVLGQCPALDRHEDSKLALKREGIWFFLKLFVHAQRDKGRSRFNLSPHKIPIVGRPQTLAVLTAPGAFEGYAKLVSPDFENSVCARALLTFGGHNPIDYAEDVQCPVLLQVCEKDNLVSEASYKKTADILGEYAEVKKYPIGHFDIYEGENFEKAVNDQITFFKKHFGI